MKRLISIASVTAALLLGGCGNDDDGGGTNSANASGGFVAAVRAVLGQDADTEPTAVDGIDTAIDDAAEPETL